MDPLSTIAAAAALCGTVTSASKLLASFVRGTKEVDARVDSLQAELESLYGSAEAIQTTLSGSAVDRRQEDSLWINVIQRLRSCELTITGFERQLKGLDGSKPRNPFRDAIRQTKLMLREEETVRLRSQLHSHNMALQIVMSTISVHMHSTHRTLTEAQVIPTLDRLVQMVEGLNLNSGLQASDPQSHNIILSNMLITTSARAVASVASSPVSSSTSGSIFRKIDDVDAGYLDQGATTSEMGSPLSPSQRGRVNDWILCAGLDDNTMTTSSNVSVRTLRFDDSEVDREAGGTSSIHSRTSAGTRRHGIATMTPSLTSGVSIPHVPPRKPVLPKTRWQGPAATEGTASSEVTSILGSGVSVDAEIYQDASDISTNNEQDSGDEVELELFNSYIAVAEKQYSQCNFAEATKFFRTALDRSMNNPKCQSHRDPDEIKTRLAACLIMDCNKLDEAQQLCEPITRTGTAAMKASAYFLLTQIHFENSNIALAIQTGKMAMRLRRQQNLISGYHDAVALLAAIYLHIDDHVEAIAYSNMLPEGHTVPLIDTGHRFLIKNGYRVDQKSDDGIKAMMFAIANDNESAINFLLGKHVSPAKTVDIADHQAGLAFQRLQGIFSDMKVASSGGLDMSIPSTITPIQAAAFHGNERLFRFLLPDGPAPSPCDRDTLHFATYGGNIEIVKYLLSHGLPSEELSPSTSRALATALLEDHPDVAELLVSDRLDGRMGYLASLIGQAGSASALDFLQKHHSLWAPNTLGTFFYWVKLDKDPNRAARKIIWLVGKGADIGQLNDPRLLNVVKRIQSEEPASVD